MIRFYSLFLRFLFSAWITWINAPLYRFPNEDIMMNDLLLVNRTAWSVDALKNNIFATLDFLQGLGTNFRMDVKVVPHFWDPAVLFGLILPINLAVIARNFVLVFVCLWALAELDRIYRAASEKTEGESALYWPVAISYVFAPQFMFEVGNHFSAVFYALPLLVLVTTKILRNAVSLNTTLSLVFGTTLFLSLSDLHVCFHLASMVLFLCIFEEHKVVLFNRRFYLLVLPVMGVMTLLAFSGPLGLILGFDSTSMSNKSSWGLRLYIDGFLRYIPRAIFAPIFSNPSCFYITPYLGIVGLAWIYRRSHPVLFVKLRSFLYLAGGFLAAGTLLYVFPSVSAKLPSVLRYHLSIFPFLFLILLLKQQTEILALARETLQSVKNLKRYLVYFGAFCTVATLRYAQRPDIGEIIIFNSSYNLTRFQQTLIGIPLVIAMGLMFSVSLGLLLRLQGRSNRISLQPFLIVLLSGFIYSFSFIISRNIILTPSDVGFNDSKLYGSFYDEIPSRIQEAIDKSEFSLAPRDFVPFAKSFSSDPHRGRNDKLLPYIEWPELIGGRIFFQWRYSYTKHLQKLYSDVTHNAGPTCFFPPGEALGKETINFATENHISFLLSADVPFNDPALKLLGEFSVTNGVASKRLLERENPSLIGNIYLYAVLPAIEAQKTYGFENVRFSRTQISLRNYSGSESNVRLPVTDQPSLTATNTQNQVVPVTQGSDGYAYVLKEHLSGTLFLKSHSILGAVNLFYPIIGIVLAILLGMLSRRDASDFQWLAR